MFSQVKTILHQWKNGTLPPVFSSATRDSALLSQAEQPHTHAGVQREAAAAVIPCAAKRNCTAKQAHDWHCSVCRVGAAGPTDCLGGCERGFMFHREFGDCTGECIKDGYTCHASTDSTGGRDIPYTRAITNESGCRTVCDGNANCWGYVVGNETDDGHFAACGACWLKGNPAGTLSPDNGGDTCRKLCLKNPAPPPAPNAPPPPHCPEGCDGCVCTEIVPHPEVKRVHYITMHHFDLGTPTLAY